MESTTTRLPPVIEGPRAKLHRPNRRQPNSLPELEQGYETSKKNPCGVDQTQNKSGRRHPSSRKIPAAEATESDRRVAAAAGVQAETLSPGAGATEARERAVFITGPKAKIHTPPRPQRARSAKEWPLRLRREPASTPLKTLGRPQQLEGGSPGTSPRVLGRPPPLERE